MKNKAVITFLGNALFDTRAMNLYNSLAQKGMEVSIISFDFLDSDFTNSDENISIYKLNKRGNSFWFYLKFISILFSKLAFKKYDYYFAEDVFTLPVVQFWSRFFGGKLIYDSRELYPFLAGLRKKSLNQKIIAAVEKRYIYRTAQVLVTGKMDGEFLADFYKIKNILLLRNLPAMQNDLKAVNLREKFSIDENSVILVYQGVLLEGRGIKLAIESIKDLSNFHLVIFGDGVFRTEFEKFSVRLGLEKRVHFAGRITQTELLNFTAGADLGLSLIENLSKSYYYALPNKLFEYIMAGVPVIVSDLPQMKSVVDTYDVGFTVDDWQPETLKKMLRQIEDDKSLLLQKSANALKAKNELHWDAEFENISAELLS